jgi:hypothetical protein
LAIGAVHQASIGQNPQSAIHLFHDDRACRVRCVAAVELRDKRAGRHGLRGVVEQRDELAA